MTASLSASAVDSDRSSVVAGSAANPRAKTIVSRPFFVVDVGVGVGVGAPSTRPDAAKPLHSPIVIHGDADGDIGGDDAREINARLADVVTDVVIHRWTSRDDENDARASSTDDASRAMVTRNRARIASRASIRARARSRTTRETRSIASGPDATRERTRRAREDAGTNGDGTSSEFHFARAFSVGTRVVDDGFALYGRAHASTRAS